MNALPLAAIIGLVTCLLTMSSILYRGGRLVGEVTSAMKENTRVMEKMQREVTALQDARHADSLLLARVVTLVEALERRVTRIEVNHDAAP